MQVTQFTFRTNEKIPPAGATFIANGPEGRGMLKVTVCAILNIAWTPAKNRLLKRKHGAVEGITVDMMAEVEQYETTQVPDGIQRNEQGIPYKRHYVSPQERAEADDFETEASMT